MKSSTDQLVSWLNSAHSMELSLAKLLENHARDAKDFPDLQARIQEHLEETRRHARTVAECLNLLGEKPSTAKSLLGDVMGRVQGMSTGMFRDELVKNCLADYASEHFEIACYRSLIAAAEALGRSQIAELCEQNLQDEERMVLWLEEQIPDVTRLILQQEATSA